MSGEADKSGAARRQFLLGLAKMACGVGLGAGGLALYAKQARAVPPQALRPPGALEEGAFQGACIRCGMCVRDCPYKILVLARPEQPIATGTPYFVARTGPCEMCEDIPCVKACPTGALDHALTDITKARMGLAVLVDHETCLNWLGMRCDVCYRVCPLIDKAITLEPQHNPVLLPAFVCFHGFILSHTYEPIDMLSQDDIDRFLPKFTPYERLDAADPISFGMYATPDYYLEFRYEMDRALKESKTIIHKAGKEFGKMFGRDYSAMIEGYRLEDADTAIVAMGSICGTTKDAIDEMRNEGRKVGLLTIRAFRPFPSEEVAKTLAHVQRVAVLDKNISLGPSRVPIWH